MVPLVAFECGKSLLVLFPNAFLKSNLMVPTHSGL
jgi:hypothetical protein